MMIQVCDRCIKEVNPTKDIVCKFGWIFQDMEIFCGEICIECQDAGMKIFKDFMTREDGTYMLNERPKEDKNE